MKKFAAILFLTPRLLFPVAATATANPFYTNLRDRANAAFFRAMDLKREKKHNAALEGIRKAIRIDPSFGTYHLQAGRLCLLNLNRYPEAVVFFRKAVTLMPGNPWPLADLALALDRAKQYGESAQICRRTIAFFKRVNRPPFYRLYPVLGRILRDRLKKPQEALAVFREGLSFFPDRIELLLESAECAAVLGNRPAVLAACRKAVELSRRYLFRVRYDTDWKIARILRKRLKAPGEALKHLAAARLRHPDRAFLKIQTAYAFSDLKSYRQAVIWYERGLNQYRQMKEPHNFWYYVFLARRLRVDLKQPARALRWLNLVYSDNPGNPHIMLRIGHAYGDLKEYRKQIRAYLQYIALEEAKKRKPGLWIYHWIADILRRDLKRPRESLRFLNRNKNKYPDDPYLRERIGHAWGALKEYAKQIAAYREYVRLCGKAGKKPSAWRLCNMGDILRSRLKDPAASLRVLNKGARLYPDDPGFPIRIGNARGVLKQYRKQYENYRLYLRLMEKKGKRPSAWVIFSCSNLLRKHLHNPQEALRLLARMRRHYPEEWQFPLHSAFAFEILKKWKEAAAAYREAIRLRERSGKPVPGWTRSWYRRAKSKAAN